MAKRSPFVSLGWTLRDYTKRVWDNAGEDNVPTCGLRAGTRIRTNQHGPTIR